MIATTDKVIASELFARIEVRRKAMGFTQATMAERIGVTPKTYRNLKDGTCSVMVLLSVLRQLNLLENLETLVPPQEIRPSQVWRQAHSRTVQSKATRSNGIASKTAEPTSGYVPQKPSGLKAVLASRQRLKSGSNRKK